MGIIKDSEKGLYPLIGYPDIVLNKARPHLQPNSHVRWSGSAFQQITEPAHLALLHLLCRRELSRLFLSLLVPRKLSKDGLHPNSLGARMWSVNLRHCVCHSQPVVSFNKRCSLGPNTAVFGSTTKNGRSTGSGPNYTCFTSNTKPCVSFNNQIVAPVANSIHAVKSISVNPSENCALLSPLSSVRK